MCRRLPLARSADPRDGRRGRRCCAPQRAGGPGCVIFVFRPKHADRALLPSYPQTTRTLPCPTPDLHTTMRVSVYQTGRGVGQQPMKTLRWTVDALSTRSSTKGGAERLERRHSGRAGQLSPRSAHSPAGPSPWLQYMCLQSNSGFYSYKQCGRRRGKLIKEQTRPPRLSSLLAPSPRHSFGTPIDGVRRARHRVRRGDRLQAVPRDDRGGGPALRKRHPLGPLLNV